MNNKSIPSICPLCKEPDSVQCLCIHNYSMCKNDHAWNICEWCKKVNVHKKIGSKPHVQRLPCIHGCKDPVNPPLPKLEHNCIRCFYPIEAHLDGTAPHSFHISPIESDETKRVFRLWEQFNTASKVSVS